MPEKTLTRGPARLAVLAAIAAALLSAPAGVRPAPAYANATQETIVQDDALLLGSGAGVREDTLNRLQSLGVDTVRAFVTWQAVAPSGDSTTRPAFDAADPAAYPDANWAPYDGLVRSAADRGLRVILTPTSPIPLWASQYTRACRGQSRRTCNPSPAEFGRFVQALGTRYSGFYPDPIGGALPRVTGWGIWNEPNLRSKLSPQTERRRGRTVPVSAVRYRLLAAAAIGALRASGHGADRILIGETAPIGRAANSVATATFLRAVLCLDARGRGLSGRAASDLGCRRPRRLEATGIAHHPYVQGGSRSPLTPARADEITISSSGRLKAIMSQAARRGRIRRGLPIYYTEYGFQTRPPDRILGVPLPTQAAYLDQSDYIAYRDGTVRGLAQYLLRDDERLSGFQSGLEFFSGRRKPSYSSFRLPIWVVRRGAYVTVFGHLRPLPRGGQAVSIQLRRAGRSSFTVRATARANARGFFTWRGLSKRGRWRLVWTAPSGGSSIQSRIATEAYR